MFDPETRAFLESGCGLLVGTVGADGEPHAGRGWGMDVLEPGRRPGCACCSTPTTSGRIAHVAGGRRHRGHGGQRADAPVDAAEGPGARARGRDTATTRRGPTRYVARRSTPTCTPTDRRALGALRAVRPGGLRGVPRRGRTSASTRRPARAPARGWSDADGTEAGAPADPAVAAGALLRGRRARGDRHRRPPTARRTSPTCRGSTWSTTSGSRCRTSSSRRPCRTWPRTRGRACC